MKCIIMLASNLLASVSIVCPQSMLIGIIIKSESVEETMVWILLVYSLARILSGYLMFLSFFVAFLLNLPTYLFFCF